MSWDSTDKKNFTAHLHSNVGQISPNDPFGKIIINYAKNPDYKTFLEIGTWNGLGSTKCFIMGLVGRTSMDYMFYSLECNKEKCQIAKNNYKNIPNVHILNQVLYNDPPSDMEEIFPELKTNSTFAYWNSVDIENMKTAQLFWNNKDLPEIFDVVLLDGGEFTTYFEYLQIKDKCRVLMMDDTNVEKCRRIVQDLKAQPDKWRIIVENTTVRNGFVIAERIFA